MVADNGRLWTPKETAEFLGLTPDNLRDLRRRRLVPFIQISRRRYRFDPSEINAWLAARRVPTLTSPTGIPHILKGEPA